MFIVFCLLFFIPLVILALVAALYMISPVVSVITVGVAATSFILYCLYKTAIRDYTPKEVVESSPDAIDVTNWETFLATYHRVFPKMGASILMLWTLLAVPAIFGGFYAPTKRVLIQYYQQNSPGIIEQLEQLQELEIEDEDEQDWDFDMGEEPVGI